MSFLMTLNFFKEHYPHLVPEMNHLDVGASGGIAKRWKVFGDKLHAIGIDPLMSEVERLNAEETNSQINYIDGYVSWPQWEEFFPPSERNKPNRNLWARSSAAALKSSEEIIEEYYNKGEQAQLSKKHYQIDELSKLLPNNQIHFLKTDTDGFDYPALRSAETMLSGNQLLGLRVECLFNMETHPHSDGFANIHRYLNEKGYTLADLDIHRYTSAELPDTFREYSYMAAANYTGSVVWADGTYIRDFSHPQFEQICGWKPTNAQIIRLIFFLELWMQVDLAAELLVKFADQLCIREKLNLVMDAIVQKYRKPELGKNYQELMDNFKNNLDVFSD